MYIKNIRFFLVCGIFSILITKCYAETFNSLQDFSSYIENFVVQKLSPTLGSDIEVSIIELDPNMNLPSCNLPIKLSLAQPEVASANNSVALFCQAKPSWNLYVPVQIKLYKNVVVASRRIMPNDTIGRDDVTLAKRDKLQLNDGYYSNVEATQGLVATRSIPEGSVLSIRQLKQPILVKKNQAVTVTIQHDAIQISMQGIAKTNGYMHDTVKIMNPSSKKIIDATVVGDGQAKIEY